MKYISVSGTVAAGKTTLLSRLLTALGGRAVAHEERPQDNPFISGSYADKKRWSFHSQVTFLALYFDNPDWLRDDHEFYFYDRCFVENLVLAKFRETTGDLTADEYAVLEKLAQGIAGLMPPVDKYVYLRCSVPLLMQRLRERGRDYEQALDQRWVENQKALYDAWADSLPKEKVLIVDEDEGVDLDAVLRFIEA